MTHNLSTPSNPNSPNGGSGLPPSRLISWLISSVIVGWAVAYNIIRIAGRSPREAAFVSFLIGLGLGAIIFVAAILIWRRLVSGARYQAAHLNEIPPPSRLDERQKSVLDTLWPAVGVAAAVLLAVGGMLAVSWARTEGTRSKMRAVIAAWDLLVGVWLLYEVWAVRRHDGEAVESIGTALLLTAVLAGVALSVEMFTVAQGVVIVISAVTGAIAYFAGWRLLGSRGIPVAATGALVVGVLSLIIPLLV